MLPISALKMNLSFVQKYVKTALLGTEFTTYKDYLQNLLDPDNEADLSAVIGLRILTQV